MRSGYTWVAMSGTLLAGGLLFVMAVDTAGAARSMGASRQAAHPFYIVHPFYISVCQVDHNPGTGALEMSFRIFMDDLELALETMGTERLHLGTEREADKADLYIGRYLERHVVVEINGRRVSAAFLGKEVESDAMWCFVEVEGIAVFETMTMTNTLLLETYEDQVNLVHVNANGQKKSMVFDRQRVTQTLDF